MLNQIRRFFFQVPHALLSTISQTKVEGILEQQCPFSDSVISGKIGMYDSKLQGSGYTTVS